MAAISSATATAVSVSTVQPPAKKMTADELMKALAERKKLADEVQAQIGKKISESNVDIRESMQEYEKLRSTGGFNGKAAYLNAADRNHPLQTRTFALEGSSHLTPQSVVVVFGPQIVNKDTFVEPLTELSSKCGKLIVVDCDDETLKLIPDEISQKKIIKKKLDLSDTLKDIAKFEARAIAEKYDLQRFRKEVGAFIDEMIKELSIRKIDWVKELELDPSKPHIEYAISSNVASEIKLGLTLMTRNYLSNHLKISGPRPEEVYKKANDMEFGDKIIAYAQACQKKHECDLKNLVGPNVLYYADTIGFHDNKIAFTPTTAFNSTFSTSDTISSKKWRWVKRGRHYVIEARLIKFAQPVINATHNVTATSNKKVSDPIAKK